MERLSRKVWTLHTSKGGKALKCEICNQEYANSEELKAHMERDHTLEERDDVELEAPDMVDQAESAPVIPGKNN